ncbi:MAG: hypothetical protein V3R73_07145, partial [Sphingomonadales bacterium]
PVNLNFKIGPLGQRFLQPALADITPGRDHIRDNINTHSANYFLFPAKICSHRMDPIRGSWP